MPVLIFIVHGYPHSTFFSGYSLEILRSEVIKLEMDRSRVGCVHFICYWFFYILIISACMGHPILDRRSGPWEANINLTKQSSYGYIFTALLMHSAIISVMEFLSQQTVRIERCWIPFCNIDKDCHLSVFFNTW